MTEEQNLSEDRTYINQTNVQPRKCGGNMHYERSGKKLMVKLKKCFA